MEGRGGIVSKVVSLSVLMSYLARVRSAAVTAPSATAFTWATAALITWRQKNKGNFKSPFLVSF